MKKFLDAARLTLSHVQFKNDALMYLFAIVLVVAVGGAMMKRLIAWEVGISFLSGTFMLPGFFGRKPRAAAALAVADELAKEVAKDEDDDDDQKPSDGPYRTAVEVSDDAHDAPTKPSLVVAPSSSSDHERRTLLRPVLLLAAAMLVITTLVGCGSFWTQKRVDAVRNVSQERALCVANMLGQPAQSILDKCGKMLTGDDLKNLQDFIFGMKEGAAAAGANIPDAPHLGTYLPPSDTGTGAR